jgi:hypothetical protein
LYTTDIITIDLSPVVSQQGLNLRDEGSFTNGVHDSGLRGGVCRHDVHDVELHNSGRVILLNVDDVLVLFVDTNKFSDNIQISIVLGLVVG